MSTNRDKATKRAFVLIANDNSQTHFSWRLHKKRKFESESNAAALSCKTIKSLRRRLQPVKKTDPRKAVFQNVVFRTDHAAVVFVIHIFPPFVIPTLGHRTLVRRRWNSLVLEDSLADPWRFVSGVQRDNIDFGKAFRDLLVDAVERRAVVQVPGMYKSPTIS